MNANDLDGRAQPGPPRRGGRWPGASRTAAPGDIGVHVAELRGAIGDLSRVLADMSPAVLSARMVALDANGMASGSEKRRFAAIGVRSYSLRTLTIAAAPLGGAAPGPGPGVSQIAPNAAQVYNMAASSWSIYGGAAGDIVYVETFSRPQPLAFDSGIGLAPQAALFNSGSVTGPGAFGNIVSLVAPPPGLYAVTLMYEVSGTVTAAEQDNLRLAVNAVVVIGTLPLFAGNAAGGPPVSISANIRVPAGSISLQAKAAAGPAAVYTALITATQIGP